MFSDDIEKLLTRGGYREFPHPNPSHRRYCRCFQMSFRTKEGGKRFINIYEWDFDGVTSHGGRSYEVVSTFETEAGHWIECKMYTLKESDILSDLEIYENRLRDAFKFFCGIGQE